jgi:hypothetical protein
MSNSLISQLQNNLRIAEQENDHWGAARIKDTLEMLLKPHIERSRKLFSPRQPPEESR